MSINLSKGGRLNLTKEAPGLNKVRVGLGWDANTFDTGTAFDLDASVFALGTDGRCANESDVVFYGNQTHKSGAIKHLGDNTTGAGDGDDEEIMVTLSDIPNEIDRIAFTVTIYEADVRNQNFGQVANAYIRLINDETNEEILRYDLGEDFSIETAIVFAEIYRKDGTWRFNAIGSGFQGGLAALCHQYGVQTEG